MTGFVYTRRLLAMTAACMMPTMSATAADWWPLTNGLDMQWTQAVHELKSSMWEHAMATRGRGSAQWPTNWLNQPMTNYDFTQAGFWRGAQDTIEDHCYAYMDQWMGNFTNSSIETAIAGREPWDNVFSVAGEVQWYNGLYPTYWYLSNWTWSTLQVATGLTNGWRRVTGTNWPADWTDYDDPAFSYGQAQTNDIFGPWLIADLRTNLSFLRYTVRLYDFSLGYYTGPWGYDYANWWQSWSCLTTNVPSGGCTNISSGWLQADAWTEHQDNWSTMLAEPGRIEEPDDLADHIPEIWGGPYVVWRNYEQLVVGSGGVTGLYQSARVSLDLIITNRAYGSGLKMDWLFFVYPFKSPSYATFDNMEWLSGKAWKWEDGTAMENTAFVVLGEKDDTSAGFDPCTQNVGPWGVWNGSNPTNDATEYQKIKLPMLCVEMWDFSYRDYELGDRL